MNYMKVTREQFIDAWRAAHANDHNMSWVAEQLGVKLQSVQSRAASMKANGVNLPKLKKYDAGKLNDLIDKGSAL